MTGLAHAKKRQSWLHGLAISLKRDWRLYLMMILPVIFYSTSHKSGHPFTAGV